MKRFWTESENALMTLHYPNKSMEFLRDLFGRSECAIYSRANTLNIAKSAEYLASAQACRLRRGDEIGKAYRFKKGQVPANKGIKGINYPGMQATQFCKGNKPANYRPVGAIREVDGYFQIKMAEGMNQWRLLHRVIWERCNGAIPKGHIVSFLDGNFKNLNIKNMTLLTKSQNMKRNTVHNYPKEIVHLVQLRGALNRQINKRTNHEQSRP